MFGEIVDEIEGAAKCIVELNARICEFKHSNVVLRQISQQISFFPIILLQQIKMIRDLDKQFGDEFHLKCIEEVREIAETAKTVLATTESALACAGANQSPEQIECAENLFKGTARLNILQQRIAGKMMKSKRPSELTELS